jgi:hypothetical protein
MPIPIRNYVKDLLKIIAKMQIDYPKKKFTLDGRLVGDIGEILAEQLYDLVLLDGLQEKYDAISNDKLVQIKTTMKKTLGFGDIPDYYLGIKVDENGKVEEIFNGPGLMIWNIIKHKKRPKNYFYSVNISRLKKLNSSVKNKDKIKRRK